MGTGFRVLHLHLHGLFRSRDLELGRDADTGGQTLYVLDLVRSLAQRPEVDRVDVVTRLIQDRRVAADYGRAEETIAPGARILRFGFGPKRYLRKDCFGPIWRISPINSCITSPDLGRGWIGFMPITPTPVSLAPW
jgi:sucrose-phosphate synthase